MKKFFLGAFILSVVLLSPILAFSQFKAIGSGKTAADFGAKTVLIVHYHRYDGNYAGWNLWIWPHKPVSIPGAAYQFTGKDAYGEYAIIKFPQKYTSLGFIVRLDDWKAKDVSVDRFADIPPSGVAEIWVVQGQHDWYTDPSKIDISPRALGCFLNSLTKVDAFLTNAIETKNWKDEVKVVIGGVDWPIKNVTPAIPGDITKTNYIEVTLAKPLSAWDVSKKMILQIKGFSPAVIYAYKALNDPIFRYDGQLGPIYSKHSTTFKVWSPVSKSVKVLLYKKASDTVPYATYTMKRNESGVWSVKVMGDLDGVYYLYQFSSYGKIRTAPDIYCYAADMYNRKSMIVNLNKTNPAKWIEDSYKGLSSQTNAVIYEMSVRDFTSLPNSGVPKKYRGKYLGLTVHDTTYDKIPTGIDHLKELGITDVHLMPIQDFWNEPFDQYNWGYITYLFNVPEAQYSTLPSSPVATIKQVKEMVMALHNAGIGVIMDVVYNHTSGVGKYSAFDQSVPYYYYRIDRKGTYLNQSGVGNTIATENYMARKFILNSLKYWLKEYHINGFRFDLLGLYDPQTVKEIATQLRKIDPHVILYGEPWGGWGVTPLFGKGKQKGMHIAVFNDNLRDGIIGSVFDPKAKGFIEGMKKNTVIERGVVGEINYSALISGFTQNPDETVNYVTSHDNYTLWDRINAAEPNWTLEQKKAAQKFANAIILTSQGVPFLAGGVEFARTKGGNGNSYNAGDIVNGFDWSRLKTFKDVDEYYAGLIKLRRSHPAFRMNDPKMIKEHITFFPKQFKQVTKYLRMPLALVAYEIKGNANGDSWKNILVIYNGESKSENFTLPSGKWNVVVNGEKAGTKILKVVSGKISVSPISAYVLYQN